VVHYYCRISKLAAATGVAAGPIVRHLRQTLPIKPPKHHWARSFAGGNRKFQCVSSRQHLGDRDRVARVVIESR
jgi:hypothetical protein